MDVQSCRALGRFRGTLRPQGPHGDNESCVCVWSLPRFSMSFVSTAFPGVHCIFSMSVVHFCFPQGVLGHVAPSMPSWTATVLSAEFTSPPTTRVSPSPTSGASSSRSWKPVIAWSPVFPWDLLALWERLVHGGVLHRIGEGGIVLQAANRALQTHDSPLQIHGCV